MFKLFFILNLFVQHFLPALGPLPKITPARQQPEAVKAIYATAYTVRNAEHMAALRQLINNTELNAIVINTKEPSGPKLDNNLKKLVAALKQDGVWTIARHVVFQDDELAVRRPELALKKPNGKLWHDSGGRTWVDPASREVWQYNLKIARDTLALGFDEINLDYIRFPTDGNTKNIKYPFWNGQTAREDIISEFAKWFRRELKAIKPQAVLSGDLFAFTFVSDWDLGMGQRVKKLAPYFDVLAPMIYPSHYTANNFGFKNPAEYPYETVKQTLKKGHALLTDSPHTIIRPWLQDFNMGAKYDAVMIKKEMQGVVDAGYKTGWMLWNPKNIYTLGALLADKN